MKKIIFLSLLGFIGLVQIQSQTVSKTVELLEAGPAFRGIVSKEAVLEVIDTNFLFVEGPVWHPEGYLLFSDIPANKIYRWQAGSGFNVYLEPSENSNGLTFDHQLRLIRCAHSARSVIRHESDGSKTVLASHYNGKKLNSPNDLVLHSSGALFFTDPCWGLKGLENSPDKELPYSGLYLLRNDSLLLIDSTLWRPNGLVLAPDENTLFVSDMFTDNTGDIKVFYRYQLDKKANVISKELLHVTNPPHEILGKVNGFDGLKTDVAGNLYCTGPHGIVVFDQNGTYLGTIVTPLAPANCAWGDEDFSTLYITARKHLYRIKLKNKGFWSQAR